jgi:hypothetical protein
MYVLVLLLTLAFVLSAANPFAGTWEENPAKSPAAANIPVSQFERDGEFLKNKNGAVEYRFKIDGKSYPLTGSPIADSGTWKKQGPRVYLHEAMKGTQLAYRNEITIAPDGKTRTWRQTSFTPDGSVRLAGTETIQDRIGGAMDAHEPLIGHWRPRRRAVVRELDDGMLEFTIGPGTYKAKPDGKDYPIAMPSGAADAISIERVNATTLKETRKKDGKLVGTGYRHLTPDGKSMIIVSPTGSVIFFDRVQ